MQEVRKILKQEKVIEEETPKSKKGSEFFQLCLVRIGNGQIVPVYLPAIGVGIVSIGDFVVFDYNGDRYQAEVLFVADYTQEDDPTWTCAAVATQTVPVKALQIGHMKSVSWKEEK